MSATASWSTWVGNDEQWDSQLLQFSRPCVYQSASWANHRKNFGWNSLRLANSDGSCKIQVLHKRVLGTTFAWIPGGPTGDLSSLNSNLVAEVSRILDTRRLYIRLNSLQDSDIDAEENLEKNRWKRVSQKFSTGLSLSLSLEGDESKRRERLSTNWGRNLRRGETRNGDPYLWKGIDAEQLSQLYQELSDYKDLKSNSDVPSFETIDSLVKSFGDNLQVFRCDDERNKPVSVRGALIFGNSAWDIFAAVSPHGRKQYSSYVTAWALFNHCSALHVQNYDLSGIDPIKNKGVYDFKHGTGATEIAYIGEWDYGSPFFIQPVVGRLLRYRKSL